MRKFLIITGIVLGSLLLVVAIVLFSLWQAAKVEPEWYAEAVEIDPVAARQSSDEMLQRTTTLISDAKKEGEWEALFTEAQINGWLAIDLVENHPDALPGEVSDPRVAIDAEEVALSCRARYKDMQRVVTLTISPSVLEPNVFAVRIRKARIGMVPLPLDEILKKISEGVQKTDARIEWRQVDGDPVAVITIPPPRENGKVIEVTSLRLGDGEVYFSGETKRQ